MKYTFIGGAPLVSRFRSGDSVIVDPNDDKLTSYYGRQGGAGIVSGVPSVGRVLVIYEDGITVDVPDQVVRHWRKNPIPSRTRAKHAALLSVSRYEDATKVYKRAMKREKRKNPPSTTKAYALDQVYTWAYALANAGLLGRDGTTSKNNLTEGRKVAARRGASSDEIKAAEQRAIAQAFSDHAARPKKNPLTAGLGGTYTVTHANPRGGSDLGAWTKSTTAQLVKNANFWINTGLSKEDALRKVFGQSSAGPKIQAEVRAQVLGRSNPRPAPSKSVKLRFSSRTEAWDAMHALDAAGIDAGFPSLGAEQTGPNKGYYTVQVARKNATAARKALGR